MPYRHDAGDFDAELARVLESAGAGLRVTELDTAATLPDESCPGVVHVGVLRGGTPWREDFARCDILLCEADAGAVARGCVAVNDLVATLGLLEARLKTNPLACAVLMQLMRSSVRLDFADALRQESLAYSMLLASAEFARWRNARRHPSKIDEGTARVRIERDNRQLHIRLHRPGSLNAFDARMRDELCEALRFAAEDPDRAAVELSGEGRAFCSGGDLDEFGSFGDVARAHLIRSLRQPAALVHAIRDRITARLHGACIGCGIEIPAAAGRVIATADSFFQLPEVAMGLIPGAGGTVTLPRRIGAQRALYLALSGERIGLGTALEWGLVDGEESA